VRAVDETTQVVVVRGEAGIGKSRLVQEFCDRRPDVIVATSHCIGFTDAARPTLSPIAGLMHALLRALDPRLHEHALGASRAALTRLLPDVADTDVDAPASEAPERVFDAVLAVIDRVATTKHLVLVLEDAQWADLSTLDCLRYLALDLKAAALIVVTVRSDEFATTPEIRRHLAELARLPNVTPLALEPLSDDVVVRLIELRSVSLARQDRDRIVVRCEGNPFFVSELLEAPRDDEDLPITLREFLVSRLIDLPDDALEVIMTAAVIGLRVEHDLLRRSCALEAPDVDRSVRVAIDRKVLVTDSSVPVYTFRHALLRDAVLSESLPFERAQTSRRVAVALEGCVADGIVIDDAQPRLAAYWRESGDSAHAIPAYVGAAEEAEALGAWSDAIELYAGALRLMPNDPERVDLLLRAASLATQTIDQSHRAIEWCRAALDVTQLSNLDEASARALLAFALYRAGDIANAIPLLDAAVAELPDQPSPQRAVVLARAAQVANMEGRDGAEDLARRALESAGTCARPDLEANALVTLAGLADDRGAHDDARLLYERARSIIRETGLVDEHFRAYANEAVGLRDQGAVGESARLVVSALDEVGFAAGCYERDAFSSAAVMDLVDLGLLDRAERIVHDPAIAAQGLRGLDHYAGATALALARGDLERAREASDLLDAAVESHGHPAVGCLAAFVALPLAARLQAWDRVEARVGQLADWIITSGYGTYNYARAWLEAVRACGEMARQAEWSDRALEHVARLTAVASQPGLAAYRLAGLAEAGLALGGGTGDAFAEAAIAFGDEVIQVLATRETEARVALRDGESDRVRSTVLAGIELATAIGAGWHVERFNDLARQGRIKVVARSSNANRYGLTQRECEVLALVVDGSTDREIADTLTVGVRTVETHVRNILMKLDVRNRGQAARVAQEERLLAA
jgi:DNA-binding CsgD family transcriptional regulator/tetratricopeptide (TPR) repeat protein